MEEFPGDIQASNKYNYHVSTRLRRLDNIQSKFDGTDRRHVEGGFYMARRIRLVIDNTATSIRRADVFD